MQLRPRREPRALVSSKERAAYDALHEASLAAPPLRQGLTAEAAGRSAKHLRRLLGGAAVCITDPSGCSRVRALATGTSRQRR